jgi:acyl-CoA hydrolase
MNKFNGSKIDAMHSFTVMPKDCNFNNNTENNNKNNILFGGKLMYEIDYAGAKLVRRATYDVDCDTIVTACVSETNFKKSAYIGDLISMKVELKKLGRTSIDVRVKVSRESLKGEIEDICSSNMTFVCKKDGKPYPHKLNFEKLQS